MHIILRHDIIPNVLFGLEDGSRVWYTDMDPEQRSQANELLHQTTHAADGLNREGDKLPSSPLESRDS